MTINSLLPLTIAYIHFTVLNGTFWSYCPLPKSDLKVIYFNNVVICYDLTQIFLMQRYLSRSGIKQHTHYQQCKEAVFIPFVSVLLNEDSSCCSISVSIFFWQCKKFGEHLSPNSQQQQGERSRKLAPVNCGDLSALLLEKRNTFQDAC